MAAKMPMIIKGMKWHYNDLMDLFYNVELEVEYKDEKVFVFVSLSEGCETIILKNNEIMSDWIKDDLDKCTMDAIYYSQTDWQHGADENYTEAEMKNDLNNEIDAMEYRNAIYFARLGVEAFEKQYDYEDLHSHSENDIQKSANKFLRSMVFPDNDLNSAVGDSLSVPEYARPD